MISAIVSGEAQSGSELEQAIAGRVAERIVDLLEAVEVEQRDADLAAVVGEQALEPHPHGVAVGEPGELVEMRELAQLLLRPLAGGDVLMHERDPAHPAVLGEYRCGGEANVDPGPVLADAGGFDSRNDLARAGARVKRG
jgi:hypothetical protein